MLTSRAGELFRVRNDTANGGEQRLEFDGFDIEFVAAPWQWPSRVSLLNRGRRLGDTIEIVAGRREP
jgi:hypothetical protein